mgnify:CR=1 FL=1
MQYFSFLFLLSDFVSHFFAKSPLFWIIENLFCLPPSIWQKYILYWTWTSDISSKSSLLPLMAVSWTRLAQFWEESWKNMNSNTWYRAIWNVWKTYKNIYELFVFIYICEKYVLSKMNLQDENGKNNVITCLFSIVMYTNF